MNNNILLRISVLILLLSGIITTGHAQDSLKKVAVKKQVVKSAIIKPGPIPINPKTGRPYSKYGYGAYAKTYHAKHIADSIKRNTTTAAPIKVPATMAPVTPPDAKPDTAAVVAQKVDKSLNGQYQYLLTKVYNYQKPFVDALWKNITDTIRANKTRLQTANDKIALQTKTITDLQTNVAAKEQALLQTDSISLLGIAIAKTTYNIIMWGLVLVIGIIAVVVIARSGALRKEAVYRTTLYNELEEEFKTFKAKANEKEKKLARELQTERNKVDELSGRG